MQKTNSARLLDKQGIQYELVSYEVDENDLSAQTVAAKVGEPLEQIFKTLVLRGDKSGVFVAIIPGNTEVDLKKTAKASGNKKAAMVQMKEILGLTGYIRGGCSPVGMKKKYPTFIHESCRYYEKIYVSAGIRGLQLKITPANLIKAADAEICDIAEE